MVVFFFFLERGFINSLETTTPRFSSKDAELSSLRIWEEKIKKGEKMEAHSGGVPTPEPMRCALSTQTDYTDYITVVFFAL